MALPDGALLDPAADQIDLAAGQFFVPRVGGRHSESRILRRDAQVQLTLRRVARDHRIAALAEVDPGAFFVVKAQFALAVGRVRSVTGEALVGKDRTDVAVEAYRLWNGIGVDTHRRRDRNEKSASDPASRWLVEHDSV